MDTVKVNKSELLQIVIRNRESHRAEFEKALEGYRKTVIEALEANLRTLRDGKAIRIIITDAPPEDHTRDYDRVISMLSMSVSTDIEISAEAYAQVVLDEWGWKHHWSVSNTKYLG